MSKSMKEVVADTLAILAVKEAAVKTANEKTAIVGQNPDSMPGAEHNKPVDASAKTPSPEIKDKNWAPPSGYEASGAGDDSKVTRGQATDSTQPPPAPKSEPLIGDDANVKAAAPAGLANSILASIQAYKAPKTAAVVPPIKAASAADDVKKDTASAEVGKTEAKSPESVMKKTDPKVGDTSEEDMTDKKAEGFNMELTQDVMAKIAAIILATDEGVKLAEELLVKQAGRDAASTTLNFLSEQNDLAIKQAAYNEGMSAADEMINAQVFLAGQQEAEKRAAYQAGAEKAESFVKAAEQLKRGNAGKASVKTAQEIPPEALAAMTGAGGAGGPAPESAGGGMPPAAPGGMPPEAAGAGMPGADAGGAAGGDAGAGAGGEQEFSIEEVVQALQHLVQTGEIQEDEAKQVIDMLTGGGDAGGQPGAEPAAGGEGPGDEGSAEHESAEPPEQEAKEKTEKPAEEATEKEEKAASAKPTVKLSSAKDVLAAITKVQAKQ